MTLAAARITKAELIAFEERVKNAFLAQHIHAPVHLSGGNEDQLLAIFQEIKDQDWVLSTWRNHYHALLKGIPSDWLYQEILAGRSMYIENKEYNFLSSSIVGGILPIACGLAMGAQHRNLDQTIWVFVGDMAAYTGIFHETYLYSMGHRLPIRFIVEDNGFSTNTPSSEVWNVDMEQLIHNDHIDRYSYSRVYPHTGVGQWVKFG